MKPFFCPHSAFRLLAPPAREIRAASNSTHEGSLNSSKVRWITAWHSASGPSSSRTSNHHAHASSPRFPCPHRHGG
jgi:hypothetical protein